MMKNMMQYDYKYDESIMKMFHYLNITTVKQLALFVNYKLYSYQSVA